MNAVAMMMHVAAIVTAGTQSEDIVADGRHQIKPVHSIPNFNRVQSIVSNKRGMVFVQEPGKIKLVDSSFNTVDSFSSQITLSEHNNSSYGNLPSYISTLSDDGFIWVSNISLFDGKEFTPNSKGCTEADRSANSYVYRYNLRDNTFDSAIRVGSAAKRIVKTPDEKYLLVSNWCSGDVSVIDPQKKVEIQRIKVGRFPFEMSTTTDSKFAFVVNVGSHYVSKINLEDFSTSKIRTGRRPISVRSSSDGEFIFVSTIDEGKLHKISVRSGKTVKTVKVSNSLHVLEIDAKQGDLYVADRNSGNIFLVDTNLNIIDKFRLSDIPRYFTFDDSTGQIWVSSFKNIHILKKESAGSTIAANSTNSSSVTAASNTESLAASPAQSTEENFASEQRADTTAEYTADTTAEYTADTTAEYTADTTAEYTPNIKPDITPDTTSEYATDFTPNTPTEYTADTTAKHAEVQTKEESQPSGKQVPKKLIQEMEKVAEIRGGISPKSVVHSGTGLFFAQNMMYRHTVTVYNRDFKLVKKIPDRVKLSDFGFTKFPGTYRGSPVEAAFSNGGKYAWVSNYSLFGSNLPRPGKDACKKSDDISPSFIYKYNTESLALEAVVKVGSVPKFISVTPDNKYVLVTNWCSFDLSIIDTHTNEEIKRLPIGTHPRGIAISPDSKSAFITIMGSSHLAKVDLSNFSVRRIMNVGKGPRHLNMGPDGKFMYISLNREGVVAKFDIESEKVISTVRTGKAPRSMALTSNGKFLYVVNYNSNTVAKIDTETMTVIDKEEVGKRPIGITLDEKENNIWVACYSGTIVVLQDAFGT